MTTYNQGLFANAPDPITPFSSDSELQSIENKVSSNIVIGRVTDIILNKDYPNINDYGGENAIGSVFFQELFNPTPTPIIALPFSLHSVIYPLVNELVIVFSLPNSNFTTDDLEANYYYMNIVGLWNNQHHNAFPDILKNSQVLNPNLDNDYQDSESGPIIRQVTDGSTDIEFNSIKNDTQRTFKERLNIHPLQPFAGDVLYQGRWGNSIRFGSTNIPFPNPNKPSSSFSQNDIPNPILPINPWSENEKNGDPLTIIRNGQNPNGPSEEEKNQGWVPIIENINSDLSSIYMTSTQKTPIEVQKPMVDDAKAYTSYTTRPDFPSEFTKPQVIINSDRLVFNAKTDHILISAQKSVFLGSNSSLNFESKEYIVDSPSIKLGKDATESLIKGDVFLSELDAVMTALQTLSNTLTTDMIWPIGVPAPNVAVNTAAVTLTNLITKFKTNIETYKSSNNKTQ